MHTTPPSLLAQLRRPDDQEAWDRFARLYTPLLFYWTRRVGLPEAEAGDLVQDVFVAVLEQMPEFKYEPGKSFRSWLRTILLNKWRNHCKRYRPAGLAGDVPEPAGPDDAGAFGEEEFRQYLVQRALQVMQTDFRPTTWRACWEHVVSGRPAAEVAADLGISVGAVYVAKSRVLARLRQELDGLMD